MKKLACKNISLFVLVLVFILVSQIRCIIQVACILKERVTAFLCITFLWRLFWRSHRSFGTSKSVLGVMLQWIEAFALQMDQSRLRDHGLICCSCGSKTTSPLHVLTRWDTYKFAIHRHHACEERFWWTLYHNFKCVFVAGALSGGLHPSWTRGEITLMSAVVSPSEYWTIVKIMHI